MTELGHSVNYQRFSGENWDGHDSVGGVERLPLFAEGLFGDQVGRESDPDAEAPYPINWGKGTLPMYLRGVDRWARAFADSGFTRALVNLEGGNRAYYTGEIRDDFEVPEWVDQADVRRWMRYHYGIVMGAIRDAGIEPVAAYATPLEERSNPVLIADGWIGQGCPPFLCSPIGVSSHTQRIWSILDSLSEIVRTYSRVIDEIGGGVSELPRLMVVAHPQSRGVWCDPDRWRTVLRMCRATVEQHGEVTGPGAVHVFADGGKERQDADVGARVSRQIAFEELGTA